MYALAKRKRPGFSTRRIPAEDMPAAGDNPEEVLVGTPHPQRARCNLN